MASPLRAWAAIVATGILVAAPAAAETPDPAAPAAPATAAPPPTAPATAEPATPAPATAAPAPPRGVAPGAPTGRRVVQPRAAWRSRRAPVALKPRVDLLPPDGTPIASSPTFARLEDGKSRIFMEVSRKVDVVESRAPGRVTYRLRGTVVVQRTNQLALPTGFFTTPVSRVQLVQQGPDLDLVIELREATTDLAYHVIETPRGMALWVDFPQSTFFGRDGAPDASPKSGRRGITTQRIGGSPPPEDTPLVEER